MDPLSVTVSVIALVQLTTSVIGYLNDVSNAPKECQQCTLEATNLLSLLTSLRFRLEGARGDDPWYTAVQALNVQNGPLDQYKRALIELREKADVTDASSKLKKRLVWKFSKAEVASVLARMERLKSLVSVALENDHFKLSEAMNAKLDALSISTQAVKESTDAMRSTQSTQQDRAILNWLSPQDSATGLNDILTRRQEGTGKWFFESAQVKTWQQGLEKTLFCPGIPGAGKTMLAATAVDWLSNQAVSDHIAVAHVFCNYKTQAQQDTGSILAAILKQLGQQRSELANPIKEMYEKSANGSSKPALDAICGALRSICSSFRTVYIVVDALDESTDADGARTTLIGKLLELQSTDVRLLFTSRILPEITERFTSCLRLEIRATDEDVRRFVSGQIPRLPKCIQRSEELKTTVMNKIVEAVDGMFLLARLHVDSLLDKRVKQKVLSTLETLTKGSTNLDVAYDEAIKRIDGQLAEDRLLARRAISWVYLAKRPLGTMQLCEALAIEPGAKWLNEDNINDVEDIISVCAGLVTLDVESGMIRLVHYTTQEYFERNGPGWYPDAQREIAISCLTCLLFNTLQPYNSGEGMLEQRLATFDRLRTGKSFLLYALRYSGDHVRPVETDVVALAKTFLFDDTQIDFFKQSLLMIKDHQSSLFVEGLNALHFTATWELPYLTGELLRDAHTGNPSTFNGQDGGGRTPLHHAAMNCSTSAMQVLLACDGIEADARDARGRTPLSYAAQYGDEAMVQQLLDRSDVNADSEDDNGRSPLSYAACYGRDAVLCLFLERDDISVDKKDLKGRTALSYAVESGSAARVSTILSKSDVQADSKDRKGRTPLIHAAKYGCEAIVDLLIRRNDVEINSRDDHDETPLHHATFESNEAVVRLLLECDSIDINARDLYGRTPLHHAIQMGCKQILPPLLQFDGVDVNAIDGNGWTPLSLAVILNDEEVVLLLVDCDDVDVNSRDTFGLTALHHAMEEGYEEVVRLLLERADIDIGLRDGEGLTPLDLAVSKGNKSIVRLIGQK